MRIELSSVLLLYLLVVVAVAAIGGGGPALVTAVSSSLYANWFFFPPVHTWTISDRDNVVALAVFILVGVIVSSFVSAVGRRAARGQPLAGRGRDPGPPRLRRCHPDPLMTLVDHLRDTFALQAVSVLSEVDPASPAADGRWRVEAAVGEGPPRTPDEATETVSIGDRHGGRPQRGPDRTPRTST